MRATSILVIKFYKGINLSIVDIVYFVGNKDCISNISSNGECAVTIFYAMQCIQRTISKYSFQLALLLYKNWFIILIIILLLDLIRSFF